MPPGRFILESNERRRRTNYSQGLPRPNFSEARSLVRSQAEKRHGWSGPTGKPAGFLGDAMGKRSTTLRIPTPPTRARRPAPSPNDQNSASDLAAARRRARQDAGTDPRRTFSRATLVVPHRFFQPSTRELAYAGFRLHDFRVPSSLRTRTSPAASFESLKRCRARAAYGSSTGRRFRSASGR
jgi:hypothetical protein